MDKEPPSKSFAKDLLLTVRLECLESNLNLEQLSKMNYIASEKYQELVKDTCDIEENYNTILEEYEISEHIIEEIRNFKDIIDQVEKSVELLEEMTLRLEAKLTIL
jgi:phosphoenolpyruvate carboxylase